MALDASEAHVRRAAADGANVLLTHHPVYIKTPQAFVPASPAYPSSAAAVFSAVECGVSIISLHTNLDRSLEVRELLPSLVDLTAATSLECASNPEALGLGSLADASSNLTLEQLASRCGVAFGCSPRVWGDPDRTLGCVAFLGGSMGDFGELALACGADDRYGRGRLSCMPRPPRPRMQRYLAWTRPQRGAVRGYLGRCACPGGI